MIRDNKNPSPVAEESIEITVKFFEELGNRELYEILKARTDVFVVEQRCAYAELDGRDLKALHVQLRRNGGLVAYLRVLDRGDFMEEVSLGRVLAVYRRQGLGTEVVKAGIRAARKYFGAETVTLEAQTYAVPLYASLGFETYGEEFTEDGIPHIRMRLVCGK